MTHQHPPARVLVVDDAPTVRLYHSSLLTAAGFEVEESGNGLEALEKALNRAYDLMVVDVNMPLMDGYSFITRLRALEDSGACAVVMVSTEAEPGDAAAAYRAGANLSLVKPVSPDLLQRVASLLTTQLPAVWSLA